MINIGNNLNSNTPSFQANLKFDGVRLTTPKKMQEIADLFAAKTQHYTNDVLDITRHTVHNDEGHFHHMAMFDVNGEHAGCAVLGSLKNYFRENSSEDIVNSLVRVFKNAKANETFGERLFNIRKNLIHAHNSMRTNLAKSEMAEAKADNILASRTRKLAELNAQRVETLEVEEAVLAAKAKAVKAQIKDHPVFDDVIFMSH